MTNFLAYAEKLVLPIIGAAIAFQSYQLSERIADYEEILADQQQAFDQLLADRNLHWDIINKILQVGKCEDPKDLKLLAVVLETLPDTEMQATFLNAVKSAAKLCKNEIISKAKKTVTSTTGQVKLTNKKQSKKLDEYSGLSSSLTEKIFQAQSQRAVRQEPIKKAANSKWGSWDFDIFFCEGHKQGVYDAKALATALKKAGAQGRLRVRELPLSKNRQAEYRIANNQIRANANDGEQKIADQLVRLSRSILPDVPIVKTASRQETPWYVSAFFCKK